MIRTRQIKISTTDGTWGVRSRFKNHVEYVETYGQKPGFCPTAPQRKPIEQKEWAKTMPVCLYVFYVIFEYTSERSVLEAQVWWSQQQHQTRTNITVRLIQPPTTPHHEDRLSSLVVQRDVARICCCRGGYQGEPTVWFVPLTILSSSRYCTYYCVVHTMLGQSYEVFALTRLIVHYYYYLFTATSPGWKGCRFWSRCWLLQAWRNAGRT